MTTTYHTPIATGAAANASTINTPLGQLDAQIVATDTIADANASELVEARNGYASVDARIDALVLGSPTSGAEVVDARGGYASLDARLDNMRPVINAITYGLTGTPAAGDVAKAQTMFTAAVDGDVLYFPAGTYYIADSDGAGHHLVLDSKNHITIMGDGGDTIFSSVDGCGTYGDHLYILGCDHIEICGIQIKDVDLTRYGTYDNGLAILNSTHVDVHHCVFGDMQNKHIHIGLGNGVDQDIRIHDCEFYHGGYNTNPGGNNTTGTYGSVFLYGPTGGTHSIQDVQIFRNHFHDNYLPCVSAYDMQNTQFQNIRVYNNIFEDSSAGILARCDGLTACGNVYRNVGWSKIKGAYYWVTTTDSGDRYYSKCRSDYSGIAYDSGNVTKAISYSPILEAVIHTATSRDVHIVDERFAGCCEAQIVTGVAEVDATASCVYMTSTYQAEVIRCVIDDQDASKAVLTPVIYLASALNGIIADNQCIMNATYGGTVNYLIRWVDGQGVRARDNAMRNFCQLYYDWHNSADGKQKYGTAAPASGTYRRGDIVWNEAADSAAGIGWVCITAYGTEGTLNGGGTTGAIDTGTAVLTVNDATGITPGCYLAIAGVSGGLLVKTVSGTTITFTGNAGATVGPAAAVSFYNNTWKDFGTIA